MIFRAVRFLLPSLLLAGLFLACGGGSSPTPPPTYTVTFVAGSGGTLTGTTSQTITSGGSASAVTAVPSSGYAFSNWTGTGFTTSTSNPLVVSNVTSNLTITANFTALPTYTVSFLPGTGGTLTGTTPQSVLSGSSATSVTAVPSLGYAFSNWTGTGFTTSTSNPLVVSNVTGNLTITANFTALPTYTVTFLAGTGGTLTGTTPQTVYLGGSTSAVTAVANNGYAFNSWTGTGFTTSTANPLVVSNVTGNLSITASFTALPATSLSYTDPTAATGVYLLKKNAALSTSTHLVLEVVGPTTGTGNGLSVSLVADTSKVTWVDVPAGGSTSTLVQNGTQFNLGTGVQILKAKATGTSLQATVAQKGATAASLNGALLRVALDLKAGLPVGVVSLSAVAAKCQLLDASGNIATITLTPGILNAQ